jgi:hypothetical protein
MMRSATASASCSSGSPGWLMDSFAWIDPVRNSHCIA